MPDIGEPISKVESIGERSMEKIQKISPDESARSSVANKEEFDALMTQQQHTENSQSQAIDDAGRKNSLIDEVRELHNKVDGWRLRVEPNDLVVQAKEAITKMDEIKEALATPDLQIKGPVQRLLNRKLSHIDENLKIALDKAGLEYTKIEDAVEGAVPNPIEKFLGYLAHGQSQLDGLAGEVSKLQDKNTEISPANMLAIQIKVNYVQQELELFTNLLNKSLESTKTLMNVQV